MPITCYGGYKCDPQKPRIHFPQQRVPHYSISIVSGCHGANGKGGQGAGAQAYPVLTNLGRLLSRKQISTILETGRGRMPSFAHISVDDRKAIVDFLLDPNIKKTNRAANANDIHNSAPGVVTAKNASYLYLPPYLNTGYTQFRDPDNYPALLSRRGER